MSDSNNPEEMTHGEFLKSLMHTEHTSVRELSESQKGEIYTYDNSPDKIEETHYADELEQVNVRTTENPSNRCLGADYHEKIWYRDNKGYSEFTTKSSNHSELPRESLI